MHQLSITGLSHKKTGIDLREKLSFTRHDYPCVLRHFELDPAVKEAVVLSTCNRVEIYCLAAGDEPIGADRVIRFIADYHKVPPGELRKHAHHYVNEAAVAHLFKVASGLDSMVLGETQILAQTKDAFACAQENESTGKFMNILFQRAFAAAKLVHTSTAISETKVSVPSVAVEFAADLFSGFEDKTLLQIGSGETGRLALTHFRDQGVDDFLLTNRTLQRAKDAAGKFGAEVVPFPEFPQHLSRADIVVAAVDAEDHLVTEEMVRSAIHSRRNRPMILLDLSVPRVISPAAGKIDNVFLYDIDDLQQVVNANMERRQAELSKCIEIVERETQAFMEQAQEWQADPLIRELRGHFEAIRVHEWKRMEGRLGGLDAGLKAELEHMTRRIVNKALHSPLTMIRSEVKGGQGYRIVELARKLFLAGGRRSRSEDKKS